MVVQNGIVGVGLGYGVGDQGIVVWFWKRWEISLYSKVSRPAMGAGSLVFSS